MLFNAINWNFGARWSDGDPVYGDRQSIRRRRWRQPDSLPQMTVLVTMISAFLCPSDTNPGSSSDFFVGGRNKLVGASNYASNIGLNRRITAGSEQSWQLERSQLRRQQLGQDRERHHRHGKFHGRDQQYGDLQRVDQGLGRADRPVAATVWRKSTTSAKIQTSTRPTTSSPSSAAGCRSPAPNQQWQWKGEWWGYGTRHDLFAHPDAQPDQLRLPRHQSGWPRLDHHGCVPAPTIRAA